MKSPRPPDAAISVQAMDECTRIRELQVYDACNQRTAIRFIDGVVCRLPFRVHVVPLDTDASGMKCHASSRNGPSESGGAARI